MEIKITMTPEQQAGDDQRALAFQKAAEADARQKVRDMPPAEYAALKAKLTRPQRRAAPVAGKHVSEMTDAEAARELRRLGVSRRRA